MDHLAERDSQSSHNASLLDDDATLRRSSSTFSSQKYMESGPASTFNPNGSSLPSTISDDHKFPASSWPGWALSAPRRPLHITLSVLLAGIVMWCLPADVWRTSSMMSTVKTEPRASEPSIPSHFGSQSSRRWLQENSGDMHAIGKPAAKKRSRPKAAIISLVRNEELEGMKQSMTELELQWNRKYQYPWIFFNDKAFSEEFKVKQVMLLFFSDLHYDRLLRPTSRQLSAIMRTFPLSTGPCRIG